MAPSSQIMMSKDDAFPLAMALSVGSAPFMVLRAVVELDVFDIIDRAGPGAQLSPTQIAANLPTTNPDATASMLDRMLRLLTTYSMLSCSVHFKPEDGRVERLYGLNPVSQFFVKKEGLGSFVLFMSDKVHMNAWYQLKDAVLDGSSAFYNTYGMRLFQFHEKDDRSNLVFNNAISSFSAILTKKMLEIYEGFEGISTLVDVGGGLGTVLNMIVSKYPAIKGINLDLQHVIINAPTYDGVEQVAGDMFKSIPKGDAIFMKWICHDWSDELCIKLLKNCHTALSNNGKVIIFDYILAMAPEASNSEKMASCFDVLMLASTEGGKERTEQEFETLAKQTGFEDFRVACSVYDMKVMELLKKN